MPVLAMSGNAPKVEVFWNTKISMQFSRQSAEARALPMMMHTCCACRPITPDKHSCPTGGCPVKVGCCGCLACVGRPLQCPDCLVKYEMRWVYETGSGLTSIGRDRRHVEVRCLPDDVHSLFNTAAQVHGKDDCGTSVVLLGYLGDAFCASCCQGETSHSGPCGSTLGLHRDRGDGKNSQQASPNTTICIGHTRTLSMVLKSPCPNPTEVPNSTELFELGHGAAFVLEPEDEVVLPRQIEGRVGLGAYYHGMVDPLSAGQISAGFVVREISTTREVDTKTNLCIVSRQDREFLHQPPPKGYGLQRKYHPNKGTGNKASRADFFDAAQMHWRGEAVMKYCKHVAPLLEKAMKDPEWCLS